MRTILLFAVLLIVESKCQTDTGNEDEGNSTNDGKDMYVIHAMVYQVGILTNSSEEPQEDLKGNEEALTFYHTNGSNLDLSKIPQPLLTNITGQSIVGVAPKQENALPPYFTTAKETTPENTPNLPRFIREIVSTNIKDNNPLKTDESIVKILNGTAVIPQEGSVQSVAIPPLLTLNNNLSNIPVPIPNTSVVQYAKISTVIKPANKTS